MSNSRKVGVAVVIATAAVIAIVGCGKKRNRIVPSAAGPARGTLIRNMIILDKVQNAATTAGAGTLCAQLVTSNVAPTKGQNLVEVSRGTCPASGLVDDQKNKVYQFTIGQPPQSGLNWAQMAPVSDPTTVYGEVLYNQAGDDVSRQSPSTLEDLCTDNGMFDYSQQCYFFAPQSDGTFLDYTS